MLPGRISPFRCDAATNYSLIAADLRQHNSVAMRYVACSGHRLACLRDSIMSHISLNALCNVQIPLSHSTSLLVLLSCRATYCTMQTSDVINGASCTTKLVDKGILIMLVLAWSQLKKTAGSCAMFTY